MSVFFSDQQPMLTTGSVDSTYVLIWPEQDSVLPYALLD
jgi:hypothetical protein